MGEPDGQPTMGSHRVGHDWSDLAAAAAVDVYEIMCVCSVSQSCLTLCDPMDCSPPGCFVHRTVQARTLEWVAISSSRASSQTRDRSHISCIFCIGSQIFITRATWEKWKSVTQLYLTLCSPWNSPAENTGVANISLLQGIFPTQGLNPSLPYCRRILYHWTTCERSKKKRRNRFSLGKFKD